MSCLACRLIKETVDHWGTVDVLVNNAGITRDTLILRMKPDQWQSVIDTNLSAVFYASQVSQAAAFGILQPTVHALCLYVVLLVNARDSKQGCNLSLIPALLTACIKLC